MEFPELYRERNPMTYVDRVKAPMLLIAGEHDSRCPLGQVMVYAHALRARGHEVESASTGVATTRSRWKRRSPIRG